MNDVVGRESVVAVDMGYGVVGGCIIVLYGVAQPNTTTTTTTPWMRPRSGRLFVWCAAPLLQ